MEIASGMITSRITFSRGTRTRSAALFLFAATAQGGQRPAALGIVLERGRDRELRLAAIVALCGGLGRRGAGLLGLGGRRFVLLQRLLAADGRGTTGTGVSRRLGRSRRRRRRPGWRRPRLPWRPAGGELILGLAAGLLALLAQLFLGELALGRVDGLALATAPLPRRGAFCSPCWERAVARARARASCSARERVRWTCPPLAALRRGAVAPRRCCAPGGRQAPVRVARAGTVAAPSGARFGLRAPAPRGPGVEAWAERRRGAIVRRRGRRGRRRADLGLADDTRTARHVQRLRGELVRRRSRLAPSARPPRLVGAAVPPPSPAAGAGRGRCRGCARGLTARRVLAGASGCGASEVAAAAAARRGARRLCRSGPAAGRLRAPRRFGAGAAGWRPAPQLAPARRPAPARRRGASSSRPRPTSCGRARSSDV